MLLEILGMAALGALGYNSIKDEESKQKTKSFIAKTMESCEKTITKKANRGEFNADQMNAYSDFEEKYSNVADRLDAWKENELKEE